MRSSLLAIQCRWAESSLYMADNTIVLTWPQLYNGINVACHHNVTVLNTINIILTPPINRTTIHPKELSPADVQHSKSTSLRIYFLQTLMHFAVTLGSQWLLIGRPFYLSYLWTLKTCLVGIKWIVTRHKWRLILQYSVALLYSPN